LPREVKEEEEEDGSEIKIAESLQFNFDTIRVATEDFSDSNKLGQGGFGAVYRVSNAVQFRHTSLKHAITAVSKLFTIPEREIFSG